MTHHLSDRDLERRTATCSLCGPVKIAKSGNGWVCAEKHKLNNRASKRRRPDRPRQSTTKHHLSWHDAETRTGVCAECGAVDIVPWGRGYACASRAKELGRVNHQDAPQTWCRDCWAECEGDPDRQRVWLRADGTCPRCSTGQDLHTELRLHEAGNRAIHDAGLGGGFHIVGGDPYSMPEYESAVPGWRTIGGTR